MVVKRHFFLFLSYLALTSVSGQDAHFTQFYAQPLSMNPALAGDFNGSLRGSLTNRRQWGQLGVPLQTNGVSVEYKLWLPGDYLVFGGQFINDKATQLGFVKNKVYATTTYEKNLRHQTWRIGVQFGFVNVGLDPEQTFPSQFDGSTGTFDSSQGNNESAFTNQRGYLDVNVGIFWSKLYFEKCLVKTGLSASHLNKPNESLLGATQRLPIRYLAHYVFEVDANPRWDFISQSQLTYAARAKEFITTLSARRALEKSQKILGGLGYRGYVLENDAVFLVLGYETYFVNVYASYDWNISQLSNESTQKTSTEISLVARIPEPKRKKPLLYKKKACPVTVPTPVKRKKMK